MHKRIAANAVFHVHERVAIAFMGEVQRDYLRFRKPGFPPPLEPLPPAYAAEANLLGHGHTSCLAPYTRAWGPCNPPMTFYGGVRGRALRVPVLLGGRLLPKLPDPFDERIVYLLF